MNHFFNIDIVPGRRGREGADEMRERTNSQEDRVYEGGAGEPSWTRCRPIIIAFSLG